MNSFINNEHSWFLGTALGTGDTVVNKLDKIPCPLELYFKEADEQLTNRNSFIIHIHNNIKKTETGKADREE